MGKKYLLYIHSEAFAGEEKKSELVNNLLQKHYDLGSKNLANLAENNASTDASTDPLEKLCDHGKESGWCMFHGCKHNPNFSRSA